MKPGKLKNLFITLFVIIWMGIFHYESVRYFYLQPLLNRPLPKLKYLFPPAGWIMFFNVDNIFGHIEVYGQTGRQMQEINPHDIIETRTVMFDNIHRNILSTVGNGAYKRQFCFYLKRKFPTYRNFTIVNVYYPDLIKDRFNKNSRVLYQCDGVL